MKIKKTMIIAEIFEKFPKKGTELAEVMYKHGLHCVGCAAAGFETLEQGCEIHGLSKKETNELLKKLNEIVKDV